MAASRKKEKVIQSSLEKEAAALLYGPPKIHHIYFPPRAVTIGDRMLGCMFAVFRKLCMLMWVEFIGGQGLMATFGLRKKVLSMWTSLMTRLVN